MGQCWCASVSSICQNGDKNSADCLVCDAVMSTKSMARKLSRHYLATQDEETPESITFRFCNASLNELHLSAKNTLRSPIEISRIYVDMLCLRCTLRP